MFFEVFNVLPLSSVWWISEYDVKVLCKAFKIGISDYKMRVQIQDTNLRKHKCNIDTEKIVNTLIDNLYDCDIDSQMLHKSICDPCCGTGNFLLGLAMKKAVQQNWQEL